jgi:hypothetical protein
MLDNLRQQASESEFEEELPDFLEEEETPPPSRGGIGMGMGSGSGKILGMNPMQRFIIAAMVFIMVCIGGFVLLLLAGKMGLAF